MTTKKKHFKVDSDTGRAFVAISELLNIDSDQLLNNLMGEYVTSVQEEIEDIANKYPSFKKQYPFITQHNDT